MSTIDKPPKNQNSAQETNEQEEKASSSATNQVKPENGSFLGKTREWLESNKYVSIAIGGVAVLGAAFMLTRGGGDQTQPETTRITTTVEVENPDGTISRETTEQIIPLAEADQSEVSGTVEENENIENAEPENWEITHISFNLNSVGAIVVEKLLYDGTEDRGFFDPQEHYTSREDLTILPTVEIPEPETEDPEDLLNNLFLKRDLSNCLADIQIEGGYSDQLLSRVYDTPDNPLFAHDKEIILNSQPFLRCSQQVARNVDVISQSNDTLVVEYDVYSGVVGTRNPGELFSRSRATLVMVNDDWRFKHIEQLEFFE